MNKKKSGNGGGTRDYFVGVVVGLLGTILLIVFLGLLDIESTRTAADELLAQRGIEYMLRERINNDQAILFATGGGCVIFYDGRLFKEME